MLDTRLLEEASEILFGDKNFHDQCPFIITDEGFKLTHPREGRDISFPALVRELSEVK